MLVASPHNLCSHRRHTGEGRESGQERKRLVSDDSCTWICTKEDRGRPVLAS